MSLRKKKSDEDDEEERRKKGRMMGRGEFIKRREEMEDL